MGESTLKGNYQNVRLWLQADMALFENDVRSPPNSGHGTGVS